jgi:hypothetical protein
MLLLYHPRHLVFPTCNAASAGHGEYEEVTHDGICRPPHLWMDFTSFYFKGSQEAALMDGFYQLLF